MTSPGRSFFVTTIRGLESYCAEEILEKFSQASADLITDSVQYLDSPGVVRFSIAADVPPRLALDTCRSLKSVMRVCALVDHVTCIPCERETSEQTLALLKSLPQDAALENRWKSGLDMWKVEHSTENEDKAPGETSSFNPTFRVSCQRNRFLVEQKLNRMQVQGWLGSGVVSKYGWKVSCKDFELEVFASLSGANLTYGVALLDDVHSRNRVPECTHTTQLNPAMAYLIARIACSEMKPTDVFCDPMCGVGTIPIEAASFLAERRRSDRGGMSSQPFVCAGGDRDDMSSQRSNDDIVSSERSDDRDDLSVQSQPFVCAGGDLCAEAVSFARANSKFAGLTHHVDFVVWDVTRDFARENSIDIVCTDLPFGQLHKMNRALYGHFTRSLSRVLRPGGKAYLLTIAKKRFLYAVSLRPELNVVETIECDVGGFQGFLFVVVKDRGEGSTASEAP